MKTHFRKKFKRRGSILVMSVFFLLILFITASAFLTLLPVENRAAVRTEKLAQAGFATDSGISEAMVFLSSKIGSTPSQEPMANGVYPTEANRTRDLGDGWTYRWSLIPDAQTFPNGSNPIRAYTIVSKAFYNGKIQRESRAEVLQESLAEYAELFDTWPDNLVKGVHSSDAPAGGKVHVNDVLRLWIQEGASFWGSPGGPHFDYGVTAFDGRRNAAGNIIPGQNPDNDGSQDGFLYYQGNWGGSSNDKKPYNNGGPIESRYARLAEGGRDGMNAFSDYIELPQNTFAMRDAAWGFNQGNPPNVLGVHLNEVSGQLQGIYIRGDVEEMQLGFGGNQPVPSAGTVNYGNNSWVKIEQPNNLTSAAGQPNRNSIDNNQCVTVVTVKEDPIVLPSGSRVNGSIITSPQTVPINSTVVRDSAGEFTTYSSVTNGMVYVNGDIKDLWGVNKGRRTVAVEAGGGVSNKIIVGGREPDNTSNANQNAANRPLSVAAGEKGLIQFGAVDSNGDGVLDRPTSSDNVLGLIGRDVMISGRLKVGGRWDSTHPSNNPLYLFAVVLGGINGDGGTYAVEDYNSGGAGWAYSYGSKIMVNAGAWGTTSGHGLVKGTSFYDESAASAPPPFFPAKPSFVVRSYVETPSNTGETL